MNLTASRKKAQEVVAGQTVCSFISAMLVVECSAFARNVIHKISHSSGKRYISNSWDQIWIFVCLYCENNIERTHYILACSWHGKKALRSLEQSAGRLCDKHKTFPNNEAHEETVHVEKSNFDVVSLGSNAFCFWMQNSLSFSSVVVFLRICERRPVRNIPIN